MGLQLQWSAYYQTGSKLELEVERHFISLGAL
jgi:hypothetical protein